MMPSKKGKLENRSNVVGAQTARWLKLCDEQNGVVGAQTVRWRAAPPRETLLKWLFTRNKATERNYINYIS